MLSTQTYLLGTHALSMCSETPLTLSGAQAMLLLLLLLQLLPLLLLLLVQGTRSRHALQCAANAACPGAGSSEGKAAG